MIQVILNFISISVILVCIGGGLAWSQDTSSSLVTAKMRLDLVKEIEKESLAIIKHDMEAFAPDSEQKPIVRVAEIEIDEAAIAAAEKEYLAEVSKKSSSQNSRFIRSAKRIIDRLQQPAGGGGSINVDNKKPVGKDDRIKLGSLNVSVDKSNASNIVSTHATAGGQISLQLSMPEESKEPFNFLLRDFIKKLAITIQVPHALGEASFERLRGRIKAEFRFDKNQAYEDGWITLTLLPKITPSFATWASKLVDSDNLAIPLLLMVIIMSIAIILASRMLAKGFDKVAVGLQEMKPKETSESEDSGPSVDIAVAEASADPGIEDGGDEESSTAFMTAEMKNIRLQLGQAVESGPEVAASLMLNLFYEKGGLGAIRDLISFMGYSQIKGALDLLPQSKMADLRNFIEDHRDELSNLRLGCETAMRLYSDICAKLSDDGEPNPDFDSLVKTLVQTDDKVLSQILVEASPEEAALIIMGVNLERSNLMNKFIPLETLKPATNLMDVAMEELASHIPDLMRKVTQAEEGKLVIKVNQKRFILRLARNSGMDREEDILALVEPDDWETKEEMLAIKVFVKNLVHVPIGLIKTCLDRETLDRKANILFVLESSIKNKVLDQYKDGSKLKDMITDELNLVESNDSRNKQVLKQKVVLLEGFAASVQKVLMDQPELQREYFQNEASALGVTYETSEGGPEVAPVDNAS